MVREGEVAPELPAAAAGPDRPGPTAAALRRPRLLSGEAWARRIRERAAGLGFDSVGFTPARLDPHHGERLRASIAAGHHGTMDWMADTLERRVSPERMWPDAVSAIVLGTAVPPAHDPLADLDRRRHGLIATYARRRDYHDVVKGRLKQLAGWLHGQSGASVKVFVDTAPLMEKPLAARTGVGWQGKHSCIVSREHGSWLILGEILTTLDLPADEPHADRCGSCRRCLDICPTAAFPEPYRLDARRCLAYLTIEHAGPIPRAFRKALGNRVFGCDDCLAVCPWNRFARDSRDTAMAARDTLGLPPLDELATLDDAGFRALFAGTPGKRTGRDRFVRNVLIAIGNSGDPTLVPATLRLVADPSPVVRGAALWALAELDPARVRTVWATRAAIETDPDVIAEAPP